MIVSHVKPVDWVDTVEAGKIQPSAVAELVHVVTLEAADVETLRGPQGLPGADGAPGVQGPQGVKGDTGLAGAQGPQGLKGDAGAQGAQGPAGGGVAGMVAFFAMAEAPAGWIKADGALVSRATYAALFAAIGDAFGAGDGVTTFGLPDLRGEFLRALDEGRGVDAGRAFGSIQLDAMQGHKHVQRGSMTTSYWSGVDNMTGGQEDTRDSVVKTGAAVTDGVSGEPRTASETRPRNVALLACISTGA